MSRNAKLLSAILLLGVVSCQDAAPPLGPDPADAPFAAAPAALHAAPGRAGWPGPTLPLPEQVARYLPGARPPAGAAASAFIGPRGGALRVGDFEIVVPPGAVERVTWFAIIPLPERGRDRHAAAHFLPHGAHFNLPVTLRVPHATTEAGDDPDAHVIWWSEGAWVERPTTRTPDGRLETSTDHFSLWATQRRMGLTIIGG